MIKRMRNDNAEFYGYMGRIFGSRQVQRDTKDRFYDDDGKEWIVDLQNGNVMSVVSVKESVIKNVYAYDIFSLIDVLKHIHTEVLGGTVPISYREAYVTAGCKVMDEKKNFLIIKGGKADE